MYQCNLKPESWDSFHKRHGTKDSVWTSSSTSLRDEPADGSSWFSRLVADALSPHDRKRVIDSDRTGPKSGRGVKGIRH
jgi:hypothetical protein